MDRKPYKIEWEKDPLLAPWISMSNDFYAFCKYCDSKLQNRLDSLRAHAYSNKHVGNVKSQKPESQKFVFIETGQKNYSVSWENFQKNMCQGLSGLQQREEFVDMTLAADGHHVKAHQMVMCLISPYIKELISSAACPHPIIFLSKISYETLESILQYAYTGEVMVSNENIQEFLTACKELHIRGLEQYSENPNLIEDQNTEFLDEENENIDYSTNANPVTSWDQDTDMDGGGDDFANDENETDSLFQCKPDSQTQKKTIKHISDVPFKFTVSNQGKPQIVLNRYVYNFRHPRKNGESYWRCCKYSTRGLLCRAGVILKDKRIIRRAHSHNHPFDDAKILKKIQKRNMFETRTEVELTKSNLQSSGIILSPFKTELSSSKTEPMNPKENVREKSVNMPSL